MEDKKINFPQTEEELSKLNNALLMLSAALDLKIQNAKKIKENSAEILAEKDRQIEQLKTSSAKALRGMEEIINKLTSTMEKNGSGNNNN